MDEQDINKERLELALEAAGLDLWENDLVTGDVTRKATKIFTELGYNEEEVASYVDDLFKIVHPDDIPMLKAAVNDHLTGVTPQYRSEFRLQSKLGKWVWFANYGKIMDRDGNNRGQRFIGVTFNINDRKSKEEELVIREQESRTLTDNSPDTIARYDLNCRRIYVNPAFSAMTDGGAAALLGKNPSEIPGGPNAKIYEAKLKEVFSTGENSQFELIWPSKDGKEVCSHIRLTAERDLSGNITSVLAVGRDITDLNAYQTELKRKELAKNRFLAAAGHDLRQPLAAANLFIDALRFTSPSPDQHHIIDRLHLAMSTFNGLLDALLDISKLDAGITKPEYSLFDVSEIFKGLEQSFTPIANEKQLELKLFFPVREKLVIRSDIGLINSVLMNLVGNAIKYTLKGAILISARKREGTVLIQVWDTGIGILPEHTDQIFDEFFQVDNRHRDRTNGLGLGLSIAKRALSLLDSEITCHSRVGRGSVFGFSVPIDQVSSELSRKTTIVDEANDIFVRGKRFIVVEDDLLVAQALTMCLETMGGEVKCFHSGEDALQYASTENGDYYIADFMLGGTLNGIQYLNKLRHNLGKPINAVLMTGDTSSSFISMMDDCDWPILHKPVNVSKLISSLAGQTQDV